VRFGALAAALFLGACAHTDVKTAASTTIQWSGPSKRVLLMEPNVTLSELEAGGGLTPRADWTASAKGFIEADIRNALASRSIDLAATGTITDPHVAQLSKLHDAVGNAILLHLYMGGVAKLPTKGKALDWTLGPGANDLRAKYGADYALFTHVEDTYTSAGRWIVMLGAAALGVGVSGGRQVGFASLVDLRTGQIVWFNLLSNAAGDLRTEKPAQDTVTHLLEGIPL
jgi:hypothetical protein